MHARSISELYEPLARGRKANCNLKKKQMRKQFFFNKTKNIHLFCMSFCHIIIYNFIELRRIFLMSEGTIETVQETKQRLILDKISTKVGIFA